MFFQACFFCTYARPAAPILLRKFSSSINRKISKEKVSAVSAVNISSPGRASSAEGVLVVVTTGVPVAIASKILFWIPAPYKSGTTETAARQRNGRISSTVPVIDQWVLPKILDSQTMGPSLPQSASQSDDAPIPGA